MEDEIVRKLRSMEDATALSVDAFEKSLRSYETEVHPILKERLVMLGCTEDDISEITSTTSYHYIQTDQGFNGKGYSNYVFQSLFDREEPEFHDIIYVKCSSKTRGPERFGNVTMDRIIERKLRDWSAEDDGPLRFKDLCESELGYDVTQDLLQDDYLESTLGRSINEFLGQNQFTFPSSTFVEVPGRVIPPDLIMSSKFYLSRNDNRAFCFDRHFLRHLCGCCLHRLFLPQEHKLRTELDRNNVIPAYGKDELSYIVPRREGKTAGLVLSDISNFTGSAGNAWLMLHVAAAQLSKSGAWDKPPNVFGVKGSFLEATWRELIIVYLYCTVGVPCTIQETGVLGYLPGGFLGIAANCTLGLVILAVVLENLKRLLKHKLDYVQAQAGGDDTCFLLCGKQDEVKAATKLIHDHLSQYVGHVKEFTIIDLEESENGVHPTARFCKKQIHIWNYGTHFEVRTLPSIPIPESLSSTGRLKSETEIRKGWLSLHAGLKNWVKKHPYNVEIYADTVRARFIELYPMLWPPTEELTLKQWNPFVLWSEIGRVLITPPALKKVNALHDLSGSMGEYLDSFQTRLRHTLKLGINLIQTATLGGMEMTIITTKGQNRMILRSKIITPVGLTWDEGLLERIRLTFFR